MADEGQKYTATRDNIRGARKAINALLAEDVDSLFAVRLATIDLALEPITDGRDKLVKALNDKCTEKDSAGKMVPNTDAKGRATGGFKIDHAKLEDYQDGLEKIDQHVVGFDCPDVKLSKLRAIQDDDGIPVPGWIVRALLAAHILTVDVEEDGAPKKEETTEGEKPRGRAASRRAAAKRKE